MNMVVIYNCKEKTYMGKRRKSLTTRVCKLEELQQTIQDLKQEFHYCNTEIEVKEMHHWGTDVWYVEIWGL